MKCSHPEHHPDVDHVCLYCVLEQRDEAQLLLRDWARDCDDTEQAREERDEARRERDEAVTLLRNANIHLLHLAEMADAFLARIDAREEGK